MNKNRFTITITAGIAVMLLLIGGTGVTTTIILFSTAHAQTATLGETNFCRKGSGRNSERNWPKQINIHFYF